MTQSKHIENKIQDLLSPSHLEIINESHNHHVPKDSETHFKLVIVSESFENKTLVQRHQRVYELLKVPLSSGVHALSLHTFTEKEWVERNKGTKTSPKCLDGFMS